MLLHRWGSLSSISGPERPRQPPYLTEQAVQLLGGSTKWSNHSDVSTGFAEIWHPSPWLDCALISFLFLSPLFSPWKDGKMWSCPIRTVLAFMLVLFTSPLICFQALFGFLGSPLWCFWPLSWTSFPAQTCFLPSPPPFPTPLHCFNALLRSPPPFFLPFSSLPCHFTFQLDSHHAIFSL